MGGLLICLFLSEFLVLILLSAGLLSLPSLKNKFQDAWNAGNVFGKMLVLVAYSIFSIIILPAVCIYLAMYLAISLIEGLVIAIIYAGFPSRRPFRKEIPIPSDEVLQSFRDKNIMFIIGKDYVAFENASDYNRAKKLL